MRRDTLAAKADLRWSPVRRTSRAMSESRDMSPAPDRRFCVAPMMDWTDRHCRAFHRVLTRRALLYTEMAVDQAVLHGDAPRLIGFDPAEQPLAIQLGGSDPDLLAQAARIAQGFGYIEINLNVGCPSDRFSRGGLAPV